MSDRSLIPRRALFGNPSRAAPRISPDGRQLCWLQPHDGVMNLWLAPVDDVAAATPLTRSARPLSGFGWTRDGRHLFYVDDINGDENRRLWSVDRETADARLLTPERGVSARLLALSSDRPGTIVVGLNDRDPAWHDAWAIDLDSGKRDLIFENRGGYGRLIFDYALSLRLLTRQNKDTGGYKVFRHEAGLDEPVLDIPHDDEFGTAILGFERDGTHYNLMSSLERDTSALFRVDASTGERHLLAEHPRADVHGLLRDAITRRAAAASFEHLRREWVAVDPAVAEDLRLLADAAGDMDFNVYSQTATGDRWIAIVYGPTEPGAYHLWDRTNRALTPLFDYRPDLKPYRFATMQAAVVKSRDDIDLVSYLTLPPDVEGSRPPEPLPMVLAVHGGPWARDQYGFNGSHQWLADRGYAVLSVNYRGSTGFGKAFVNAGDREHAGRMHDDLIDAVD